MLYHQNNSDICCLISLAVSLTALGQRNSEKAIERRIEGSILCQSQGYKDSIEFANSIMSDQVKNPGDQRLHYSSKKLKKVQFNIIHDISENVTLVQLMDSIGNVNHAVSIVVY